MNNINQVIVEGNVVRQPEKHEYPNGIKVCKVPIAVNRYYKNQNGESQEEVSFFDVAAFGNMAEMCEKWCPKGRGIRVVGRLKQNMWKSEDGKSHSKIEIIAEHVDFKPFLKKNEETPEGAASTPVPEDKKKQLEMLTQAAKATQDFVESSEEITF